jgi:lipopolysaccharide export system protein LptC
MTLRADTDFDQRRRVFQRLSLRNRFVTVLRLALPLLGALVLALLCAQIYITSLTRQYGVSRISIDRDSIAVDTPKYAGVMADGSSYSMTSASAKAALNAMDVIDLSDAKVNFSKADGTQMNAVAAAASMQTTDQLVFIPGLANVSDSTGTRGTLNASVVNWPHQTLHSTGKVHFDYADGTVIDAEGLDYDAKARTWTFHQATVVLAKTPGEQP